MPEPLRTPFFDLHQSFGAKMVDFAGWTMPLSYTGIVDEHQKCRTSGGFFDVSHMGRLRFVGDDAARFLDRVTTRAASALKPGQSRYGFVTNAEGGIEDDVILANLNGELSMVCNASNREKLLAHFEAVRAAEGFEVTVLDRTFETAMAALQGPKVMGEIGPILEDYLGEDPAGLKRFGCCRGEIMGQPLDVYRSGYTGEDGVEIVVPANLAGMLVDALGGHLQDGPIYPCGLGARDTLRIEAALPLYGHEMDATVDPISLGMGWAVNKEAEFLGSDRLRPIAQEGPSRVLVGLELDGRRTARQGNAVVADQVPVGAVTSGCFSPTLGKSVAMAFVGSEYAGIGGEIGVDFRREVVRATVTPLPFYRRA